MKTDDLASVYLNGSVCQMQYIMQVVEAREHFFRQATLGVRSEGTMLNTMLHVHG